MAEERQIHESQEGPNFRTKDVSAAALITTPRSWCYTELKKTLDYLNSGPDDILLSARIKTSSIENTSHRAAEIL